MAGEACVDLLSVGTGFAAGRLRGEVASLVLLVRSGIKDDPASKGGLHHLVEHVLFAGLDKGRHALHEAFVTTMEYTLFQFLFPDRHLEECLGQIVERLERRDVDPEAVRRESRAISREMVERRANAFDRYVDNLASEYWGAAQPGEISRADVAELVEARHRNTSCQALTYVGPRSGDEVSAIVNDVWASSCGAPLERAVPASPPELAAPYWHEWEGDVVTVLPTCGYRGIESYVYRILLVYFLDCLSRELRQKGGLVYAIHHSVLLYPDRGFIVLLVPNCAGSGEAVVRTIEDTTRRVMALGDGDADELRAYCRSELFECTLRFESTKQLAHAMALSALRDEWRTPEALLESLENLQAPQLTGATSRMFGLFEEAGEAIDRLRF